MPIYLTKHGTPMSANLFRDHYWRPALKAAGIYASPHITRHWFVTNALRNIENSASPEAELSRRKQELIQYMSWRSGERTMKAYEHLERGASFGRRLKAIHQTMRRRELEAGRQIPQLPVTNRRSEPEALSGERDRLQTQRKTFLQDLAGWGKVQPRFARPRRIMSPYVPRSIERRPDGKGSELPVGWGSKEHLRNVAMRIMGLMRAMRD